MAQNTLDPTFIIQVQLAILGVVLVTGLFYIWRTVCRIEDKVECARARSSFPPATCEVQPAESGATAAAAASEACNDIDMTTTDEIMKSVFGDVFVLGGMMGAAGGPVRVGTGIHVTEITEDESSETEDDEPATVVVQESITEEDETPSVTGGVLTKAKLNKMHVNMLKELCAQRGLSSEGTKQVLTDRILGSI